MPILTRYAFLALFLLALPMSACDNADPDPDPDPTPSIGGTYASSVYDPNSGQSGELELQIPDMTSGSFSFADDLSVEEGGVTVSLDVSGTGNYDHPDITMTLTVGDESETYGGTVSTAGDIITVTNSSSSETLRLTRQ